MARPPRIAPCELRVEVEVRRVEQRRPAGALEGGVGREALRVGEQAAEVERVHDALLQAVGERRELRDVLQDRDGVRDVLARHARPVRRAEREVVLRAHVLDVVLVDLRVAEPSRPWP